jgi:hypothetical protein
MFGNLSTQPSVPKTLANIDANQVNSNQSAVPVPYFAGTRRLPFNFIAPIYNPVSIKITQTTGKDQTSTVGYNYSGDVAGVLACVGNRVPLAQFTYFIFDSTIVWSGSVSFGSDYYEPVTVTNFGLFRIYKGSASQPLDDLVLAPIGALPPGVDPRDTTTWPNGYRYQVTWVGQKILFGKNRNTPPNMELEASRGVPWFGGTALGFISSGVTVPGVLYEFTTDPIFGLGMADSELYEAGWVATETVFAATSIRIAPLITDQMDFKQLLSDLSPIGDLWMRVRGAQFELGWWPTGLTATQIADLPVIGSDDIIEEGDIDSLGYFDDCVTEVNVAFSDGAHWFHTDSVVYKNPALERQLGEKRPTYLDMTQYIIDAGVALQFATIYGTKYGRPKIGTTIKVKVERIEAIEDAASGAPIAGQIVMIELASIELEIAFRVIDCQYPGDDTNFCTLTIENERAIWPSRYIQPPPPKLGNFRVTIPTIANHRVLELPSGLKDSQAIEVVTLAQRPQTSIAGFHVWTSIDNVTFDPAPVPCLFADYGTIVNAAYPSSTPADDTTVGMQVKFLGVDLPASLSHTQKLDNVLLAFVDDEIMSIGTITPLGAGVYRCYAYRGRYGTPVDTHSIGAKVFMILRANIVPIANKNFVIGNDIYFKEQPYDSHQTFDLDDVASFIYTIEGGAVGGIANLTLNADYTGTVTGTVDSFITATWDYIDDQEISFFNVQHKRVSDTNWTTINVGKVTTWKVSNLEPGIPYEVQVEAINSKGEPSAWSGSETIKTATGLTLLPPTFTNDYDGTPLESRSYTNSDPISVRAHTAAAGRQIRLVIGGADTPTSMKWGWYPANHGDVSPGFPTIAGREGQGPDDFVGYIQSDGVPGSGYEGKSQDFHACVVDPAHDTVLGPEAIISLNYTSPDVTTWPKVIEPYDYYVGGTKGAAGYQIAFDDQDSSATLYVSYNLGASWSVYTARTTITLAANATAWCQAKRFIAPAWDQYQDSDIDEFVNTASGLPDLPGGGHRQVP